MLRSAEDVARTLGDMKGAMMKLGQVMSMMTGVLPEGVAAQLATLQANAPPMAYNLVEQVFLGDRGRPPAALFRHFEREPFAAASIGQVHRATLRDGRRVAVKVQYPGVGEAIQHDLANFRLLLGLAGRTAPRLDAGAMLDEMAAGIGGELDYLREAQSQQRFRDLFEGHAFVRIPRVVHELTSPHVLVQEYLEGKPFADAAALSQRERDHIGECVFRFAFGSFYRHGLFNGDPHAGNYLLLPGGGVGFVDFGCVAEFPVATVDRFKGLIDALLEADLERWRRSSEEVGILHRDAPFTTADLYEHMRWFWAPILEDDVTFTPELAAEMIRRNTQTTGEGGRINRHLNVPAGMVYLTRINFGLAGLLGSLRARGPWRAIVREYVYDEPPCTELGRRSANTSRGRGV